jgi:hypothetical protein
VGSYEEVSRYMRDGFQSFILDIPPSREELQHIQTAFGGQSGSRFVNRLLQDSVKESNKPDPRSSVSAEMQTLSGRCLLARIQLVSSSRNCS